MAKKFKSSKGKRFTKDEIENLPPINIDREDYESWVAYQDGRGVLPQKIYDKLNNYEEEHGISAMEVQNYKREIDEEYQRLNTEVRFDEAGQPYEQFALNLDDEQKKPSVTERLSNVKDRLQFGAWKTLNKIPEKAKEIKDKASLASWQTANDAGELVNESVDKAKGIKDKVTMKMWQASENMKNITEKPTEKVTETAQKVTETSKGMTGRLGAMVAIKQGNIMDGLQERHYALSKNLEAKRNIRDFASDDLDKSELARMMASDPDLRKSIESVSDSMLHPSPIKGLKTERTNLQIDIGYGFSVFMDEIRKPSESQVEAIMEIENLSSLVEMGQDKTVPPHVRENYLTEAGVSEEHMGEFVTAGDYSDYMSKLQDKLRDGHIERLGLDADNLSEADSKMLDELVEDTLSLDDKDEAFEYEGNLEDMETYEDVYGMSAEHMFVVYTDEEDYNKLDIDKLEFPTHVDYEFKDAEFMEGAVTNYHDMQNMSIDETKAQMEMVEKRIKEYQAKEQPEQPKEQAPEQPEQPKEPAPEQPQEEPVLNNADIEDLAEGQSEQMEFDFGDDDIEDLNDTKSQQMT